jgi:hypothetical protein
MSPRFSTTRFKTQSRAENQISGVLGSTHFSTRLRLSKPHPPGQWPGDRDVAMTPKLLEAARLSEQNRFAIEIIR